MVSVGELRHDCRRVFLSTRPGHGRLASDRPWAQAIERLFEPLTPRMNGDYLTRRPLPLVTAARFAVKPAPLPPCFPGLRDVPGVTFGREVPAAVRTIKIFFSERRRGVCTREPYSWPRPARPRPLRLRAEFRNVARLADQCFHSWPWPQRSWPATSFMWTWSASPGCTWSSSSTCAPVSCYDTKSRCCAARSPARGWTGLTALCSPPWQGSCQVACGCAGS